MRLTIRSLNAIKPGKARREIPDSVLSGLYFIVQPSGATSWALRYRHDGRSRKYTIGTYPAIGLKAARDLASVALRAVSEGRDPAQERQEHRAAGGHDRVERIVEQFIERHVRHLRSTTARENERILRTEVLPRWKQRRIDQITKRDVIEIVDRIVDRDAKIMANRTLGVIRKFFAWCIERDIVAVNPSAGIGMLAQTSRDRVLDTAELAAVWRAAESLAFPHGALVKTLILTGQRRSEVAGMQWSELDLGNGRMWRLPPGRVKNDKGHDVPLAEPVVAILQALPRIADSDFVFTYDGRAPITDFAKAKRQIDALLPADITHWQLHDLRRSCATHMARLGVDLVVVEKILNHTSGALRGVAKIYNRFEYADPAARALDAWAQHVMSLLEPPANNVVKLNKAG